MREEGGYEALVERAGLRIEDLRIVRSHEQSGRAAYLIMTLAGTA